MLKDPRKVFKTLKVVSPVENRIDYYRLNWFNPITYLVLISGFIVAFIIGGIAECGEFTDEFNE